MGKGNFRRMMLFRDHETEPKRDRLEEERERREREMERRLRKLEEEDKGYRRSWEIRENNRYYDPMEYPQEEPPYRGMPQIGFSANTDHKQEPMHYGGASTKSVKMNRPHLTHDEAEEWCDTMVNADGTKGCHWTLEQTADVAKQRGINCDKNDFWAVMNMMYSDYCKIAAKHSVDTPGFYADLAKAFLDDADAVDGKAYAYWDCITDK